MEKIKDIFKWLKTKYYLRLLIELVLGIVLFNVNITFEILFAIVISLEVIFATNEDSLYIFLFMSFFDEVIKSEFLNGSISRILMLIIMAKLMLCILKNKIKPNQYQMGIAIFLMISIIVGIFTYHSLSMEVMIIVLNFAIFLLYSMVIKVQDSKQIDAFVKKLLITIVCAVLSSIAYGLITCNFLMEMEGEKVAYRFKGTYEPNFMCMFANLGVISFLFLREEIKNKIIYSLLLSIMITASLLTVSVTGLATLACVGFLYVVVYRKEIITRWKEILIVFGMTSLLFFGTQMCLSLNSKIYENVYNRNIERVVNSNISKEKDEMDNSWKNRIIFLIEKMKEGDFNRFSSGRLSLIATFFVASFDRSFMNVLFGNDMTVKKLYCDYFGDEFYSHCSYVDMLYNFGVVGLMVMIMYLFRITKNNIYFGKNICDCQYKNAIKLIRIMLLIYFVALSMYTKRMVLIFFIL